MDRWTLCAAFLALAIPRSVHAGPQKPQAMSEGLKGYIHMNVPAPDAGDFGFGIGFYATAWPLVEKPIADFQIGLPSTWIIPDNRDFDLPLCPKGTIARDHWPERGPSYRDVFQTIEGGLGFWASTQFGSATAKYRMNGTTNCYSHEISSPLFGFGRPDALREDQLGIAQLSNRLLVPPDGLTFETGTNGEVFGNAWLALPIVPRTKESGDESWTLFVRATNYKGPLAFYIPNAWSAIAKGNDNAAGRTLDAKAGLMSGGAMEVNTVPRFVGRDAKGVEYSKVPRLQFPVDEEGHTVLMQDVAMYSKAALFEPFAAWLKGEGSLDKAFDAQSAYFPKCGTDPIELRQGPGNLRLTGLDGIVETTMLGTSTFGLSWKKRGSGAGMASFPEYFKRDGEVMIAVSRSEVPKETGLVEAEFLPARRGRPYVAPVTKNTVWTDPGPAAGPFTRPLSDGSVVTFYWYRFVDQPSIRAFHFSPQEQERMQAIAERVHGFWAKSELTLPPPSRGKLAKLDSALLVAPPKGLEVGYVPIVTGQAAKD